MFLDAIQWANESLRLEAVSKCKGDASCLFDAAATKDVSIGAASKEISVSFEEEKKQLGKFKTLIQHPCTIINREL